MERVIAALLRLGVVVSAAILLVGGVRYLAEHRADAPHYRVFHGEPAEFRNVGGILDAAEGLRGRGLAQLGVVVLVLTPVARVLFSVLGFARQRDFVFVGLTCIVLGVLLVDMLGALR